VLANHIQAAHFQGLGACTDAVLAFYDPETNQYQKTVYKQQMEIVSITGDTEPIHRTYDETFKVWLLKP
jgi:predicted DNA-binding protein with PD1-like motif